MATFKFNLIHGLTVGKDVLKDVVMKDHLTAGEILAASEESEKIVMVDVPDQDEQEPTFVISPTLMGKETLRRQIKRIGNVEGPISLREIESLHEDDLDCLNKAANRIAAIKVSKEVAQRGRPDTGR